MKKVFKGILKGNVYKEPQIIKNQEKGGQGGWLLGYFAKKPFCTKEFEIKFGNHKKGDRKKTIGCNKKAKTITVLIKGKFLINFHRKNKKIFKRVLLKRRGEFVFYEPKMAHSWQALEKSLTLAIRWPSIRGDQKEL